MTTKRAAIYVRVSSEKQAEPDKASPDEQEKDCRELCQAKGYNVIAIYKDTERYRVGKRLVEPSGSRADRPQLKAMLTDARAGMFDLIIAWREDRLYRGMRPMLDVLDCIEQTPVDIELVKETFDKRLAPVKAWAARMELDARKDRTAMGLAARFNSGKVWTKGIPYGYCKGDDDKPAENPLEAKWVKTIWEMRAAGESLSAIKRCLLENDAPQRRMDLIKFRWQISKVQKILRNPIYHTGVQAITWEGRTFEIQYPVLIDADTAARVKAIREKENGFHNRHHVYNYLAQGLVYCAACGRKLIAATHYQYRSKGNRRNTLASNYRCANLFHQNRVEGCCKGQSAKKLDAQLWAKVLIVLNNGDDFERAIQEKIDALRKSEGDALEGIGRIDRELERIADERQWVITQARKKTITESDMEQQLGTLDAQANDLRRELSDLSLLVGDGAGRLIKWANHYRAELRDKLDWLTSDDPENAQKQFEARRGIVEGIVRKVNVYADKSIKVEFEFDPKDGTMIKNRQGWLRVCTFI